MCYQADNKAVNCPVCTPLMAKLAEPLPFSHRIHSSLVCRLSGDVINDHNPPMVLPNGYVYGHNVCGAPVVQKHPRASGCLVLLRRTGVRSGSLRDLWAAERRTSMPTTCAVCMWRAE